MRGYREGLRDFQDMLMRVFYDGLAIFTPALLEWEKLNHRKINACFCEQGFQYPDSVMQMLDFNPVSVA